MEEEIVQPESVTVEEVNTAIDTAIKELEKDILEQEKAQQEIDKKNAEEYQKNNEDIQKSIKTNNDQIKTLSGDIEDLKQLIANENAINPESLTYSVEISQDQIDKMKVKEKEYIDLAVIWVSIFVAIALSYVGIRGMFGKWMR